MNHEGNNGTCEEMLYLCSRVSQRLSVSRVKKILICVKT